MTAAISLMAPEFSAEPTVSAGYAKALQDLAVAKGADPAALVAQSGVSAGELEDLDTRIPFARFKSLMRAAKTLCGDPALALRFGANSPMQKMSIVGLAAYAAETVEEALAQLNRYGRLIVEAEGLDGGDRFVVVRRDGETWLEDRRRDDFPELTESTWARFVCEFAFHHPDKPYVKAIHVTHPAPAHRAAYDDILQRPVTFDSDRNALLVDEAWLAWRIGPPNRYVFGIFSEHAKGLLKALEETRTVGGQVERLLIPILHTGDLGMASVAKRMGAYE